MLDLLRVATSRATSSPFAASTPLDGLEVIPAANASQSWNPAERAIACLTHLRVVVQRPHVGKVAVSLGALCDIVEAMAAYPRAADVQAAAAGTLAFLCVDGEAPVRKQALDAGALEAVCAALSTFDNTSEVASDPGAAPENCIMALCALVALPTSAACLSRGP